MPLDTATLPDDALVDRRTAAAMLHVRPSTLSTWASTGRHDLPYIRVGGAARYRVGTLRQWLAKRTGTSVGELDAAGV